MLFFLLSCCFVLFDLCSFHFCLCVWLKQSHVILSASNRKTNMGETQSLAVVFHLCLLRRGWGHSLDKKKKIKKNLGIGTELLSNIIKAKEASTVSTLPVHLRKLLTPTSHMALVVAKFKIRNTMRFPQKIKSRYLLSPMGQRWKRSTPQGKECPPPGGDT